MGSGGLFAGKIAFSTTVLVVFPSYYFCYRKREHQESVIELMMAVNDFRPGGEMPETIPLDGDHPFLDVRDKAADDGTGGVERDLRKEFVARLKEKKDWQEPYGTQDAEEVFREAKKK
jgi:hypothetical protein